jgi:hypothetical protein
MKIMRYLLGAVMALAIVGCEPFEDDTKSYPELESLANTLWYSYDQVDNIYYDITYGENGEGVMLGYSEQERVNEVVNRPFSYTFTPATTDIGAIVRVDFEDGQHYGGLLIPKGHIQINLQDVYIIQLYEVYENGEVIYNVDGTMKSTLQMWYEGPEAGL